MAEFQWETFDAALFDLDGVLTPTAIVHRQAWKRAFDGFLAEAVGGGDRRPFTDDDYLTYVDGRPRYDGVRSFLESRGICLPDGDASDAPGHGTVSALGNAKNRAFNAVLADEGVSPYPDATALLDALAGLGLAMAVVSSSANALEVLDAAGLTPRFGFVMDGVVARRRRLPGKPAPDTFLAAATEVGTVAARAVVLEDAVSGVVAAAAGGFGATIGVDRTGSAEDLAAAGATLVVTDLRDLLPGAR